MARTKQTLSAAQSIIEDVEAIPVGSRLPADEHRLSRAQAYVDMHGKVMAAQVDGATAAEIRVQYSHRSKDDLTDALDELGL